MTASARCSTTCSCRRPEAATRAAPLTRASCSDSADNPPPHTSQSHRHGRPGSGAAPPGPGRLRQFLCDNRSADDRRHGDPDPAGQRHRHDRHRDRGVPRHDRPARVPRHAPAVRRDAAPVPGPLRRRAPGPARPGTRRPGASGHRPPTTGRSTCSAPRSATGPRRTGAPPIPPGRCAAAGSPRTGPGPCPKPASSRCWAGPR